MVGEGVAVGAAVAEVDALRPRLLRLRLDRVTLVDLVLVGVPQSRAFLSRVRNRGTMC